MDELDQEIGKLLRLKRYEQPPPAYFENFIHEFHRRQRDELLRQPLWRLALQRAQDLMFNLNVPSLASYPVAAAAVLICAAVFTLKVYQTPETTNVAQYEVATIDASTAGTVNWSLSSPVAARDFRTPNFRSVGESAQTQRTAPPRYVLDSTPVSYESAAFRF